MSESKKSRIITLESDRSDLESELSTIDENVTYFESTLAKYNTKIDSLVSNPSTTKQYLSELSFLNRSRDDLTERISTLYSLKAKKITFVNNINEELKRLY